MSRNHSASVCSGTFSHRSPGPFEVTRFLLRTSSLAAFLSVQALQAAEPIPAYITAVIVDPSRPDADRERDAGRKPELVIAFAGVKPGDKVADFMPGRGYFTRLFCKLVGETGYVYAIDVAPNTPAASPAPEWAHACTNVTLTTLQVKKRPAPELWSASDDPGGVYEYWSFTPAAETFATPEPLDVIWIAESYHDLHNAAFGSPHLHTVHKALLAALRPGGVLVSEDHCVERLWRTRCSDVASHRHRAGEARGDRRRFRVRGCHRCPA